MHGVVLPVYLMQKVCFAGLEVELWPTKGANARLRVCGFSRLCVLHIAILPLHPANKVYRTFGVRRRVVVV
jgi:hypothetical protein